MVSLATKILRGEEIGNGLDLGLTGYENMNFAPGSDKVLIGSGWIVMNKENMLDYNF
jgi:simple sugar transport system substrate-binding protein